MKRALFVCTQNLQRSPTAERVFSGRPGLEVASAGIARDAATPVSPELIRWADIVFVMEPWHRDALLRRFGPSLGDKRVICLEIPDRYWFMDPALIELLRARAEPYLQE